MVTPRHQLHSKRQKKVHDYSKKAIDDFKLIIVNTSPNLTEQEKKSVMNYFDYSSQDQCIDTNTVKRRSGIFFYISLYLPWNTQNAMYRVFRKALRKISMLPLIETI